MVLLANVLNIHIKCRYAVCRYAVCRYAVCRYAEYRGAFRATVVE